MNPAAVTTDPRAANLEEAERHLARFRASAVPHFINGAADHGSGRTFENLNPTDNSVLCQVDRKSVV